MSKYTSDAEHERNRSVTFLKRKNGLFKKAYELGVLCSVDVAVIIFEERPGHHAKLYQYCSTDVNGMVQRHLRFDGERDTKGPADFSNNNNSKAEDPADDDDEGEDDDSSQKRRDGGKTTKVKAESSTPSIVPIRPGPADVSISPDLDYRSNMRLSPSSHSSATIPISGERHTSSITSATRGVPISSTAKRPRLDDTSHSLQSAPAALGANSNHIGGSPTFPYRIDIDLPSYSSSGASSIIPSLSQLHSQHPSLSIYSSPSSMSNLMSSPASFLAQTSFDLSRGHGASGLRTVNFPQGGSAPYSPHGQQPPPSLFSRPQPGGGGGGGGGHSQSHGGSHGHASASSLFADLLGTAGEHGNGAGHAGGAAPQFPSFDWPVHASQASQQGAPGQHENASQGSPSAENNWFDLFTGPSTGTAAHAAAGLSLPPPVPPLSGARFGGSPGLSRKRLREETSDSGESEEPGRSSRAGMNGSATRSGSEHNNS
ncbi:hypothetical protein BD413DRAFT_636420 [Trametes elegans]|nr:hypothetical protein BD413DRAFT_636420 [Trametes elegans]